MKKIIFVLGLMLSINNSNAQWSRVGGVNPTLLQNQNQQLVIDIKQLVKGIYVIQIQLNNGDIKTEKLVVE